VSWLEEGCWFSLSLKEVDFYGYWLYWLAIRKNDGAGDKRKLFAFMVIQLGSISAWGNDSEG